MPTLRVSLQVRVRIFVPRQPLPHERLRGQRESDHRGDEDDGGGVSHYLQELWLYVIRCVLISPKYIVANCLSKRFCQKKVQNWGTNSVPDLHILLIWVSVKTGTTELQFATGSHQNPPGNVSVFFGRVKWCRRDL